MSLDELRRKQEKLKIQINEKERETVIDIVESLFQKKGIDGTTMDDISRAVGISKGTLYNKYFNRKEDAVLAIAIRAYRTLTIMFQTAADKTKPGIDQVAVMGRQYFKFAQEFPIYRQTFDVAVSLLDISELKERKTKTQLEKSLKIIKEFETTNAEFVRVWAEIIRNAQKLGEITEEYNAMQITYVLGTITTGLVDEILQRSEWSKGVGLTNEQVLDIGINFLKNGLRSPMGKPQ